MPRLLLAIFISTIWVTGYFHSANAQTTDAKLKTDIGEVLKNNPDLIIEALKGHEEELYDLLQTGLVKKNKSRIRNNRLAQLKNPKTAALHPKRPVWGNPEGDISIIVFSDFQSATCSKADKIIQQLLKKHPEINYRFRHNPLGLYKMSRPAALYYEALALQSNEKAKRFNHLVLKNRLKIKKGGRNFLDKLALETGADLHRLHKDITSAKVNSTVDNDIRESRKLGFTASPVFLVNGVTITGAAPLVEFEEVFKMIRQQ
ncbi:DsbA family protein [Maridesulfovibrio hydrothermalis]|uniref:DSBA oxidoreductase n=1 Tax=Maridesulfovibrio hydrothermalis AM13 = DSM 14728 TaxID=1121451 RepID=L0RB04_9BACT|nr:thioredoxin domain-containing protein [Maridesulfovibrio hydrothermalis]CCO23380.1 DSBA oxidoreductase [Maridesulfovibrio hydrothermalis AM13 = DSM 14728]